MYSNNSTDKKLQKRISAVSSRELSSFNWFFPYLILPWHPKTAKASWNFIGTVFKNFVILQFFEKWKIYKIPIVNVQVPMDEKIPFTPSKVVIYMHFVNFWLSPITMLLRRYGISRALPFVKEFLVLITKVYAEAAKVYRFRLSTTNRPVYKENARFKTIHNLDPHFLCVPSLHVAIVVLCFSFFKQLFERENFTEEEKSKWNKELYEGAIAITESVLFVKQHSVNCIPSAVYMMTQITELLPKEDGAEFLGRLFENCPEIPADDRKEVVNYMLNMYNNLSDKRQYFDKWEEPIKSWLVNHEKGLN